MGLPHFSIYWLLGTLLPLLAYFWLQLGISENLPKNIRFQKFLENFITFNVCSLYVNADLRCQILSCWYNGAGDISYDSFLAWTLQQCGLILLSLSMFCQMLSSKFHLSPQLHYALSDAACMPETLVHTCMCVLYCPVSSRWLQKAECQHMVSSSLSFMFMLYFSPVKRSRIVLDSCCRNPLRCATD